MPVNPIHYGNFRTYFHDRVVWPGQAPLQWANSALPNMVEAAVLAELPNTPLSRADVRAFCDDPNYSDGACFIVIMAWGGRNAANGRRAWSHACTVDLVRETRNRNIQRTRAEWFDKWRQAEIPGLGAAYFTKLMYFLRPPEEGCYIFDQWTARSANLLCASTPAARHSGLIAYLTMNAGQGTMWVDQRNSGVEYEDYCRLVDSLARDIGVTTESVEEAMFSGGGHHRWRTYLRVHFGDTKSK